MNARSQDTSSMNVISKKYDKEGKEESYATNMK